MAINLLGTGGQSNTFPQQTVRTDVGVVVFNPQTNRFERPMGISVGDFNPLTGGYSDSYLQRQEQQEYDRNLARRQQEREAERQAQFDLRAEERADMFDESLSQTVRQREQQAGFTQSDAFRGLLGLYDSFGLGQQSGQNPLGFSPSDAQIGELDTYITEALRAGDFTRDDLFGFRRDDSLARPSYTSGFGEYVLNLIGNQRRTNRPSYTPAVSQGSTPSFPSLTSQQREFNLANFQQAAPGTFFGS
tara:strand:- start:249 stop:989 length:741 start_codon:yes stop_codon:yes gene_type:complete